jgi:hypothetical protein
MYWHSVGLGFKALLSWQIGVGMLGVGFASLLFMFLIGLMMNSSESEKTVSGLFAIIGSPFIQAFSISAFVLFLLPALLGSQGFTPWEVVSVIIGIVFKSGIIAMVIVFALCFMPIIGQVIVNTPGLPVFLQGIFIFKPISRKLFSVLTGTHIPNDVYPGFFECVGYFVIGGGVTWALLFVFCMAEDKVKQKTDPFGHMMSPYSNEPTGFLFLIGQFIGPMIGIVPLLMYGQYVVLGLGDLAK